MPQRINVRPILCNKHRKRTIMIVNVAAIKHGYYVSPSNARMENCLSMKFGSATSYWKGKSIKYFALHACHWTRAKKDCFFSILCFLLEDQLISLSGPKMKFPNLTCQWKKVEEHIWNHVFNDAKWKGKRAHTHTHTASAFIVFWTFYLRLRVNGELSRFSVCRKYLETHNRD